MSTVRRAFVLSAAVVVSAASSAYAVGFGPSSGGLSYADNSVHTFTHVQLTSAFTSAMNWARVDAVDRRTEVTTVYESRTSQTDVVAFDEAYPENYLGLSRCISRAGTSSDRCQQWEIFLNTRMFVGRPQDQRTHTAVHEVGHTLGFNHSTETGSPMRSGYLTNIVFTAHEVNDHLNPKY